MKVKQVIVVRKDLNMRKGKLAAQAAHASMKVILDRLAPMADYSEFEKHEIVPDYWIIDVGFDNPLYEWITGPFAKIVVYVEDEQSLLKLKKEADEASIINALITDSGRTEFHGVPTNTALAIGPDYSDKIDKITGDLPLL